MSRLLASAIAILLLASAHSAQTPPASTERQIAAEYPPQDWPVWESVRQGLLQVQVAAAPAPHPASVDAIRLYATTADTGRLLDSFRLIVDEHPDRIPSALEALGDQVLLLDVTGDHEERMRQIVADARQRLPDLPREDAARAARLLMTFEVTLRRDGRSAWVGSMERLVDEYQGTEAALLAQVDLIESAGVSPEMFDRLDAIVEPGDEGRSEPFVRQGIAR